MFYGANLTCFSDLKSLYVGVLREQFLGLFYFRCIFNDIAKHLFSLARLFADDSSLFYSAAHIADIAGINKHNSQLSANWARQWLLTFNTLRIP